MRPSTEIAREGYLWPGTKVVRLPLDDDSFIAEHEAMVATQKPPLPQG